MYDLPDFDDTQRKLHKLAYYERHDHKEDAILREKQLKGKTRAKKEDLINSLNPKWDELDPSPSLHSGSG